MVASAEDLAESNSMGREVGIIGGIRWGEHPRCRWKLEHPVEALMVFIMQNSIWGRGQTQPFWLHWTWKQINWSIVLFVCSLELSVWGSMWTVWLLLISQMLSTDVTWKACLYWRPNQVVSHFHNTNCWKPEVQCPQQWHQFMWVWFIHWSPIYQSWTRCSCNLCQLGGAQWNPGWHCHCTHLVSVEGVGGQVVLLFGICPIGKHHKMGCRTFQDQCTC